MKKEIDKNRTSLKRNLLRMMFGTALLTMTSMTSFGQTSDPGGDAFWKYLRENPHDVVVQSYYSNPEDVNVLHCIKNRVVLSQSNNGLTPEQISQLQAEQTYLTAQIIFVSQLVAQGVSLDDAMASWDREQIELGFTNGVTTTGNPSNSAPIEGPTMTAQ